MTDPRFTDMDLYLHGEGRFLRAYEKLGAHVCECDGRRGVQFAVWAPNAKSVSVIGSFNDWNAESDFLEPQGASGIWAGFIENAGSGALYKYAVRGEHGFYAEKADPCGFATEIRPNTASVVWDLDRFEWHDAQWMTARHDTKWHRRPISIYEVHLGSWMRVAEENNRWLNFRELTEKLIPYVKENGFTHIEILPVAEHPFDGSWGYQVSGYFAPTARYGTPDDFRAFIDACHCAGIGVILDWVPAHFPKDAHALAYFDGTHLYEHSDPRKGEHRDWGTLIFNYSRHEVRNFLLSNAMFWADRYHIDGLRVDAVASMLYLNYSREEGDWVPNEQGGHENWEAVHLLQEFNATIHAEYPGILTFAEESTAWPNVTGFVSGGGLGFDFKWNMGWMNDTLTYFSKEPVHRKFHQDELTFSMVYAFSEKFLLPFSHDEVVHGKAAMLSKMPGDRWQQFANIRLLYAYMFAHPGKKLLFMGGEFGQWDEWSADRSLDWHLLCGDEHADLQKFVRRLNQLYVSMPEFFEYDESWEGFEWIDFSDRDSSVISFMRRSRHCCSVCILNLTPVVRGGYRIGLPQDGSWKVMLNSDAEEFSGSGAGPAIGSVLESGPMPWHKREHSLQVDLPPLGALWLSPA